MVDSNCLPQASKCHWISMYQMLNSSNQYKTHPSWAMLYLVYWIYNTSLSAFLCKEMVLACFRLSLHWNSFLFFLVETLHPLFFWICTCKVLYQYIVNERTSTICKGMFFLKSPEYCYLFNYGQYYSSKYIKACITVIISIKQKKCLLIYIVKYTAY